MKYETFDFIMNNKGQFLYDNATTGGSDGSVDPTAKSINPNAYLAPIVGRKTRRILITIVLVLLIIYLIKKTF